MTRLALLAALAFVASGGPATAATPAPHAASPAHAGAPKRINVESIQPKALLPKKRLHVEYVVEVNRMGQVARVRSVKPSGDQPFDAHTYGNALQSFIRTPDGNALAGSYRLTYDYDPKTTRVRRGVALVKAGGVNPDAKGAVDDMLAIARRNQNRTPPPGLSATPRPVPSTSSTRLPDLPQVMKSPSH